MCPIIPSVTVIASMYCRYVFLDSRSMKRRIRMFDTIASRILLEEVDLIVYRRAVTRNTWTISGFGGLLNREVNTSLENKGFTVSSR